MFPDCDVLVSSYSAPERAEIEDFFHKNGFNRLIDAPSSFSFPSPPFLFLRSEKVVEK
jgi:hypothetical protein